MDKVFFADRDALYLLMDEPSFINPIECWDNRNMYFGERGMIRGVRVIKVDSSERFAEEWENCSGVEVVTNIDELLPPKSMYIPNKLPRDVARETIGWILIVLLICSPVLLLAILFSLL